MTSLERSIAENAYALEMLVTEWNGRDEENRKPSDDRTANDSVALVDIMHKQLDELRARLVREMCRTDAATLARINEILNARRIGEAS